MVNYDFKIEIDINNPHGVASENLRCVQFADSVFLLAGYPLDNEMRLMSYENLARMIHNSIGALQTVNGTFCGIQISADSIVIFSDRITTCKVYFAVYNRKVYISTNPDEVAKACPRTPEVNFETFSELLARRGCPPNSTLYKHVYSLAIGQAAIINRHNSGLRWHRYDTVFGSGIIDCRTKKQIAENIIEELGNCISSAFQNHSSGGG